VVLTDRPYVDPRLDPAAAARARGSSALVGDAHAPLIVPDASNPIVPDFGFTAL
jgi:hypothetical protein